MDMNMKKLIIKELETGKYIKDHNKEDHTSKIKIKIKWTTDVNEAKTFKDVGELSWYQSMLSPLRLSGIDLNHPRIKEALKLGLQL